MAHGVGSVADSTPTEFEAKSARDGAWLVFCHIYEGVSKSFI